MEGKEDLYNNFSGGRADGKKPKNYDSKAIEVGKEIEMEHTNNPGIATEIAMDHLEEHSKYYDDKVGLPAMEKKFEEKKKAAIESLIRIAERLDQKGHIEEANAIDRILITAKEVLISDQIRDIKTREQLEAHKDRFKEEIMMEFKYQIEQVNKYLGSIEYSIKMGRPTDRTGDLEWHLNRLKEAFEDLRVLEEKEKEIEDREEEERSDIEFENLEV